MLLRRVRPDKKDYPMMIVATPTHINVFALHIGPNNKQANIQRMFDTFDHKKQLLHYQFECFIIEFD